MFYNKVLISWEFHTSIVFFLTYQPTIFSFLNFPYLPSIFLSQNHMLYFKIPKSPHSACYLYVHGYRIIYPNMGTFSGHVSLNKTDFPSLSSHQINSQLVSARGGTSWVPPQFLIGFWLAWSIACSYFLCKVNVYNSLVIS